MAQCKVSLGDFVLNESGPEIKGCSKDVDLFRKDPKNIFDGVSVGAAVSSVTLVFPCTQDEQQRINTIRPLALDRKNYLFAGSHKSAQRSARLYSFLGTCTINEVDPLKWLTDVLNRIPDHKTDKLTVLFPNNYKYIRNESSERP